MKFKIGCSGFQYDDWLGNFYPQTLPKKYFFTYYARYFNTTEINSTFYSFPNEQTINSWLRKASEFKSFTFSFKYPQELTHSEYALSYKGIEVALDFEKKVIEPFFSKGNLGAGLIQLSPELRPDKDTELMSKIKNLFSSLNTSRYRYALEIRNSSFLRKEHLGSLLKILEDSNVALVSVDSPGLPVFYYPTADFSYVRFHGRNEDIWFKRQEENDGRLNRYDYLYSTNELLPWTDLVKRMNGDVFIYFNNHAYAKAAKNAIEFSKLLGINFEAKDYNQRDLSSFED